MKPFFSLSLSPETSCLLSSLYGAAVYYVDTSGTGFEFAFIKLFLIVQDVFRLLSRFYQFLFIIFHVYASFLSFSQHFVHRPFPNIIQECGKNTTDYFTVRLIDLLLPF